MLVREEAICVSDIFRVEKGSCVLVWKNESLSLF